MEKLRKRSASNCSRDCVASIVCEKSPNNITTVLHEPSDHKSCPKVKMMKQVIQTIYPDILILLILKPTVKKHLKLTDLFLKIRLMYNTVCQTCSRYQNSQFLNYSNVTQNLPWSFWAVFCNREKIQKTWWSVLILNQYWKNKFQELAVILYSDEFVSGTADFSVSWADIYNVIGLL